MRQIAVALVHYPVLDREGGIVTSAVTNLDVHDIARSALTYGLSAYYVIHPILAQRELVERIKSHWVEGSGGRRIPDRVAPLQLVRVLPSLSEAKTEFGSGGPVIVWTTGASLNQQSVCLSHGAASSLLHTSGPPVMILFGTGWGLPPQLHEGADACLASIPAAGPRGFNHLSVRAAAAIMFDRLLGEFSEGKRARPTG